MKKILQVRKVDKKIQVKKVTKKGGKTKERKNSKSNFKVPKKGDTKSKRKRTKIDFLKKRGLKQTFKN